MKRRRLTMLGIAEVGALAVLWRSSRAAPLVAFERDVELFSERHRTDEHVRHTARAV